MEPLFHESFSHCDMEIVYSKLSILFDRRIINYTIDSFRVLRVKLKKKKRMGSRLHSAVQISSAKEGDGLWFCFGFLGFIFVVCLVNLVFYDRVSASPGIFCIIRDIILNTLMKLKIVILNTLLIAIGLKMHVCVLYMRRRE